MTDRTLLSSRENQIVDLAIEGLTDQQIAQRLNIKASTVNSYWVRIRGKLGQLSRTELVAGCLRSENRNEVDALHKRIAELEEQAALKDDLLAEANEADFYRPMLDALPDAMMALDSKGKILYANSRLCELFGFRAGELDGRMLDTLVEGGVATRNGIRDYLGRLEYRKLGIDSILYGRRRDGRLFRIIVTLDSASSPVGIVTSCIVRGFMDEVDERRHRAERTLRALEIFTS